MFTLFRRRGNAATRTYRRGARPPAAAAPSYRMVTRPPPGPPWSNAAPTWATQPTMALPRPGRAGWLTPAQAWRANGGRW